MMPNGDPLGRKTQGASDDELISINRLIKAQDSLMSHGIGGGHEDGEWWSSPKGNPKGSKNKNKDKDKDGKGKVEDKTER